MKLTLKEMQGLLNGKCLPSDLIVGETLAEYLVRRFDELEQKLADSQHEFTASDSTADNLKMQLEKVVAENGQMMRFLTDISENHDEYVNQDEYLYAGVPMDYVSEINAYVSRDVEAENPFKETDAYLAEVRAQGVEMLANFCATANNGYEIHPDIEEIRLFAAQFRESKGVQS